MIVNHLKLTNFRPYFNLELDFDESVNLIYGPNASGKTSILEAIYFLSSGNSFKTSNSRDLINKDKDYLFVECIVSNLKGPFKLTGYVDEKIKKMTISGKTVKKTLDLVGLLKVVDFSSSDLFLLLGYGKDRMKLFDKIICQISKDYANLYILLNRLVNERNEALKRLKIENGAKLQTYFESINLEYIKAYSAFIELRKKFINAISPYIKKIHKKISLGEEIEIVYKPYSEVIGLEQNLRNSFTQDVEKGYTACSYKRDDCIFIINNKNTLKYFSQGQQKNLLISLKLAFAEYLKDVSGESPVILLDDVFGDLDKNRQNMLLQTLDNQYQTILTTSSIGDLNSDLIKNFNVINIEKGCI